MKCWTVYESQAGIKIAGSNINNLRNANDTTVMAESEEELKSLLIKVKEERDSGKMIIKWYGLSFSGDGKVLEFDGSHPSHQPGELNDF